MALKDLLSRAMGYMGRALGRKPGVDPRMTTQSRNFIDGVHQCFGLLARPDNIPLETYERMYETDETIGAGIDFLALSVVSQVGDYVNAAHPEAQEFVRECLEDLEGSFHLWLAGMLKSALWSGYAVSEPVYRWDGERVRPYRLELLNPRSLNFEVDLAEGPDRGRLAAVHQWWGTGWAVRLEAAHVIHFAYDQAAVHGNPYGRSLLKRVYKNWFLKDAILKAWALTLERCGTPLPTGKVTNGDVEVELPDGTVTTKRQVLLDALNNLSNSSALVYDSDQEVTLNQVARSVGDDFLKAQEHLNRMALRGLLMPSLVLDNSNTGSYSLGKEHRDIYDQAVTALRMDATEMVLEQIVRPLLTWNFGPDLESWGGFEQVSVQSPEDQKARAEKWNTLGQGGWISPEVLDDLNMVREDIGAPPVQDLLPMMPASTPGLPGPDEAIDQDEEPAEMSAADSRLTDQVRTFAQSYRR